MYTILICAILGCLSTFLLCHRSERMGFIFPMAIIGGLVGLLIAICIPKSDTEEFTLTKQIISLKDNKGESGWYLSITPTMNYSMYVESADGYELVTVGTDNTTIKFDSINPRIEYHANRNVPDRLDNFALLRNFGDSIVFKTIIYVPEGTIQKTFKLDAE